MFINFAQVNYIQFRELLSKQSVILGKGQIVNSYGRSVVLGRGRVGE